MNKLINYLVYVTGALPFVRQGLLLHLLEIPPERHAVSACGGMNAPG